MADQGQGQPFAIVGNHATSRLVPGEAAGAEIDRLSAVVALPLIADLGFVAAPELPRRGAEEHAAVEVRAVGDDFELEDKVAVLPLRLQVTVPVFHVEPAFGRDRIDGLAAGDLTSQVEVRLKSARYVLSVPRL